VVSPLNNFNKNCWTIFDWLCKYLQQVALLVKIYENIELSNNFKVLCNFGTHITKSLTKVIIVARRNGQELTTSLFHPCDRVNDTICSESNMLHSSATVVIDVFLNLRFPLTSSWLVDWHFNILIEVTNYYGSQG